MEQISLLDSPSDDFKAIQRYMDYTKQFSESPPAFHLATFFQTIACIIGRGRYIIQGEDNIHPNLYTMIIAPSSLHKKSSSISLLKKWLQRLQMMSQFIGQIGSPEGLFGALRENGGSATAYYSEAGLLLAQVAGKKWMGDTLEMLNDLYDSPDNYRKRLVSGPQEAKNTCLNLIGASQLDSLTKHVKESDLLSGFLPRFAVVFEDNLQKHMVRRPAPDSILQKKILSHFNEIRKATKERQPMDLNNNAWEYFETWGNNKYAQAIVAPPQIQPMYGRLEAHALKHAMIIHVSRYPHETEIDTTSTMAACDYANHILNNYRRLVTEELTFTWNEKNLKKVETIIKQGGEIPDRVVANGTRHLKRHQRFEIYELLEDMRHIKSFEGEKGGLWLKWIGD